MSCPDCFKGRTNAGTPTGKVTTLHGLPTYIASPADGTTPVGTIIYIPDVFGWDFVNNRLLADEYARHGPFEVLLPDFMNGTAVASSVMDDIEVATDAAKGMLARVPAGLRTVAAMVPFFAQNRASVTTPRVFGFCRAVRDASILPVGAAGFCWGGKHVTLLCSGDEKASDGVRPLIDAGYAAHPSSLAVPADIEPIRVPLSYANGSEDIQLTPPKMDIVRPIFERKTMEGVECELIVYDGAKHGFAVRAGQGETQVRQMHEAREQGVKFFQKHLAVARTSK